MLLIQDEFTINMELLMNHQVNRFYLMINLLHNDLVNIQKIESLEIML